MGGGLFADGKAVTALIGRKEGNCKRFVGRPYNNFLFYYTIHTGLSTTLNESAM